MTTLDGNNKNLLSNFSVEEITEVKEALAEGGYINVAAEDILQILEKVQAQTNALKKEKDERQLLKNEATKDNSNFNTNNKHNIRRKSKLQSKYDNNTEQDILALGREYYHDSTHNNNLHESNESRYGSGNSSISINNNGRKEEEQEELYKVNKLHGRESYTGQKEHSYFSYPRKLSEIPEEHQYYHYNHDHLSGRPRSAAPSWNSSTHVPRLANRGPHFPLANERVRLTPNDLLHSVTHSQFSNTYTGDPLSHRARLERELRKYYHHEHHHHQHNILEEKEQHQSASKFENNLHAISENNIKNTNSTIADNNVVRDNSMYMRCNNNQDNAVANHSQCGVDVPTSRWRQKAHINTNTSTATTINSNVNHTNSEQNMSPADRRAANLIFAITGDNRYRFRPATSNLNSFQCDNNNIDYNNCYCERIYSHMYNASAIDRHKGKALSNFSVSYLNADGSTLCERADPVKRGAQMRELWRRDRFLRKHIECASKP